MVRANYRKYSQKSGALTEYHEFPGRTHWLIAQPGWEEIAAFVDDWLQKRASNVTIDAGNDIRKHTLPLLTYCCHSRLLNYPQTGEMDTLAR